MRIGTLLLSLGLPVATLGQNFTISTFAGNTNIGDGGPAAAAMLRAVQGIAVDRVGNLYIADADDHRIRKVTPSGSIVTFAGTGVPGFSGDGGPATLARLNTPYGLAVDRFGNVYVADFHNGRVRKISADGLLTTVAGGGMRPPGGDADGSPAIEAQLRAPRNIAVDGTGNIYFSDFEAHRVYKIGAYGLLSTAAGTGGAGARGDGGIAQRAELSYPSGLAVDAGGALYIADSGNRRIRKVADGLISSLGGPGGPLMFGGPTGLAMDFSGNLYVADPLFGQVVKVTPAGAVSAISTAARDVAVEPAGTVYTAGSNYVVKVASPGESVMVAGTGQADNWGDRKPALEARFGRPAAIAFTANGSMLVADPAANRVRVISPGGIVTTLGSNLKAPQGVAADQFGNIYISDTGNRTIRRVQGTAWSTVAAGVTFQTAGPLATDEYGNLYVSDIDGHRVLRISPSARVDVFAGTGQRGDRGDGGQATLAQLAEPRGLATDREGNLYVADSGNHKIRKITPGGIISTVVSGLSFPQGVAVSSVGEIFVTEAGSHSVRMVSGQGLRSLAGTGNPGFSGDGGDAAAAELHVPSGIAIDALGNLYFADSGNRRIRKLTASTMDPPPPLLTASVANGASFAVSPLAPGEIVSIFCSGAGPATAMGAKLASEGLLATQLADVVVRFDGTPAPLLHVSENQINLVVPYSVAGQSVTAVEVTRAGAVKAQFTAPVADSAPGLFTLSGGAGQVIAVHTDGTLNSQANPAPRGSIVTLYATGEGVRNPAATDGRLADTLARPVLPVSLSIAGYTAELLYAGAAPGFAGLMQINARVPSGFAPTGEQQVTLKVGNAESQAGVTVWIR